MEKYSGFMCIIFVRIKLRISWHLLLQKCGYSNSQGKI